MVLPNPTTMAALMSAAVAVLAAIMAYLGWKSYRNTGNQRLVFIVLAFFLFIVKSLFTAYNVTSHAVPHDSIELVGSMLDLIIVLLLFIPFFLNPKR